MKQLITVMVESTKVLFTLAVTLSIISGVLAAGRRGRGERQRRGQQSGYDDRDANQNPENYRDLNLSLSVNQPYNAPQEQSYNTPSPQYGYNTPPVNSEEYLVPAPPQVVYSPSASQQDYQVPLTYDFFQSRQHNENQEHYLTSASERDSHQPRQPHTSRDFFPSHQHTEHEQNVIPIPDSMPEYSENQQRSGWNEDNSAQIPFFNFLDPRQSPAHSTNSQHGRYATAVEAEPNLNQEVDSGLEAAFGFEVGSGYGTQHGENLAEVGAEVRHLQAGEDSRRVSNYGVAPGSGSPFHAGASSSGAPIYGGASSSDAPFYAVASSSGAPFYGGESSSGAPFYGVAPGSGSPFYGGVSSSGAPFYGIASSSGAPFYEGASSSGAPFYGVAPGETAFDQGAAPESGAGPSENPRNVDTRLMSQGDINVSNVVRYKPRENTCYLNINSLPKNHGLITDVKKDSVVYPSKQDSIRLKKGKHIMVWCPYENSFLKLSDEENREEENRSVQMILECADDNKLIHVAKNRDLAPAEYECSEEVKPLFRQGRSTLICNGLSQFEFGFPLRQFQNLLDLCIDINGIDWDVKFVISRLSPSLLGQEAFGEFDESYYSVQFLQDSDLFHAKRTAELYNEVNQSLLIQLGTDQYERLTQGNESLYYITPGFLAGRYDQVYRSEQKVAYYHVNMKPMWSNLKRNWDNVERAISKYPIENNKGIMVYSGTHGKLSHKNIFNQDADLYLGLKNGNPFQYIPFLFWKMLVDKDRNCLVIIGYNTPYEVDSPICMKDVTDEILWLKNVLLSGQENGRVISCSCQEDIGLDYFSRLKKAKLLK